MMEMNFKYPLKNYEVIQMAISSYLKYPDDADGRERYIANFMFEHARKDDGLACNNKEHGELMAKTTSLAYDYAKQRNVYNFFRASIAGHILQTMLRMKASGITPSILKAQYFYHACIQHREGSEGKKIIRSKRDLLQVWKEYKSVAHIALTDGLFHDNYSIQGYPHYLATLAVIQREYLEIIKKRNKLNFEIWEMPPLRNLYWDANQTIPPIEFLKRYNSLVNFEPFNEKELKILSEYSNAYFN